MSFLQFPQTPTSPTIQGEHISSNLPPDVEKVTTIVDLMNASIGTLSVRDNPFGGNYAFTIVAEGDREDLRRKSRPRITGRTAGYDASAGSVSWHAVGIIDIAYVRERLRKQMEDQEKKQREGVNEIQGMWESMCSEPAIKLFISKHSSKTSCRTK